MLDEKGGITPTFRDADNLPKWLHEAGANKVLSDGAFGALTWVPNHNAKKFPGGGWRINGPSGWVQVAKILQGILDERRHVTLNVRGDDRSKNGMY